MKTSLRTLGLGLMVAVFSIATTPSSASAATALGVGGSRADCVAKQSAVTDIAALKTYGKKRVEFREKSLVKYQDSTLDKKYDSLDKQFNTAKSSAEKKLKKDLNLAKPANHKGQLIAERKAISANLESKKQTINNSNSAAEIAEANCSIIWDLRISSFVAPKFSYQYTLDTYAYKNAVNKALYKVAQDKNKTSGIKNPNELDKSINNLQGVLNGITIDSTKPTDTTKFNPQGAAGKEVFAQKLGDIKSVQTEIKETSSKLKTATREVTTERKKSAAATTTTASSTSSSSGSDTTSSSSGSSGGASTSSSSGGTTASNKKSTSFKKPKDVAKWCLDAGLGKTKNDGANAACKEGANKAWSSKNYSSDAGKACNVRKGGKSRVEVVYNWCAGGYTKAYKAKYGSDAKNSGYVANFGVKTKPTKTKAPKATTPAKTTVSQTSPKRATIASTCTSAHFKGIPHVITSEQQQQACRRGFISDGIDYCSPIYEGKGSYSKWTSDTRHAGFDACKYGRDTVSK